MDRSSTRFFHGVGEEETWIDALLETELPGVFAGLSAWRAARECLLADVGDYILRILCILSSFATRIAYGETVVAYVGAQATALAEERDMQTTDYLDDKHAMLKSRTNAEQPPPFHSTDRSSRLLANKLSSTAEECKALWASGPQVPMNDNQALPVPNAGHPMAYRPRTHPALVTNSRATSMSSASSTSPRTVYVPTDMEAESDNEHARSSTGGGDELPSREALMRRGTGHYTCSQGPACTKGGIQPDGSLTVFPRNSAFRAHLQRHEKWFKCEVPGCTNTKGFARIDGLERHKRDIHGLH